MSGTILVVEDDPAVALALEVALKGEGYTTLVAGSGDRGLELGLAEAPDLLISTSASRAWTASSCCGACAPAARRPP